MPKKTDATDLLQSGRLLTISALIAATLGVSACVPLAATGIALGAIAVIDRRTIGAQTEDQGIELKAIAELRKVITDASGIAVTSFNRRVLLTGQVLSGIDKQNAGAVIAGLTNVRGVYNELEIAGKSSLGSDASDATLTTKVKTVLLRDQDVPGNSIKVKTEQAVVYLMGLVTHAEAQKAAELTSQVAGVSRVITVFEILSPEEAERLSTSLGKSKPANRPATPPAAGQPVPPVPGDQRVQPHQNAPQGVVPAPVPGAAGVAPVPTQQAVPPASRQATPPPASRQAPPSPASPQVTPSPASQPATQTPAPTQAPLVAPVKTQ